MGDDSAMTSGSVDMVPDPKSITLRFAVLDFESNIMFSGCGGVVVGVE